MNALVTLTELGALVGEGLAAAEEHVRSATDPLPEKAGAALSEMLQRGKRLRPLVLLLSAEACGGYDQSSIRLAAVVELVHMASVVHDDVIDGTAWRRGLPAAPRRLGNRLAVVLGDMLVATAWRGALASAVAGATTILAGALMEMVTAEASEMAATGHRVTEEQYLRTIGGKTAALFEAAACLGAHSAGAPPEQVERLAAYGYHLGMAFQVSDDLLDLFGDPLTLGKTTGADLAAGVYTLPVIHACQAEGGEVLEPLLSAIRREHKGNGTTAEVVRPVRSLGGERYARATVERSCAQAQDALQALPPSAAREALADLTTLILDREV